MIEGQEGVTWNEWVTLARLAEDLGFEALYRSDHHLSLFEPARRSSIDAWAVIPALAALTSRLRYGTLVSPVGFRHPSQFAKTVASADQISGGRVEVGIGAGWMEAEHRNLGFPFPETAGRFSVLEEYLEVVQLLWTQEAVTFSGSFYRLVEARSSPKPAQKPHPPIIMGGLARPRAASLAARYAAEYNLYDTSPDQVAPARQRLAAACEAAGRDPQTLGISINGNVLIGVDQAEVEKRASRHLQYQALAITPQAHLAALGPERLVGTPAQILDQLASYKAAGVSRMMMQVFPHNDLEAIELIGKEVLPEAGRLD
jgi:F420-dependent oxidoreductase-like protein